MSLAKRRETPSVPIGNVLMGSRHPVVIQSMTITPTANVDETAQQIIELANAGSELVRITVNDYNAMEAVVPIVKQLRANGITTPLVGDFHYNGHILLEKYPESAALLDKYRINPGNVGKGKKRNENFEACIKLAMRYGKPVRIGVNWGSLDQDLFTQMMDENAAQDEPGSFKEVVYKAMVKSAVDSAEIAESLGLSRDKIVLSVKMSELQDMVNVYETLAKKTDHVLHLGLTEAGGSLKGVASSSAALAILLQQGIGDTIRISLTPEPGVNRDMEVKNCRALLQSMGLRYFMPSVTSCPGCGRTNSEAYLNLAKDVTTYIETMMPQWKQSYPGVERMIVAVMGCVVNGPGESKHANIGISLPGSYEAPSMPVYMDGTLRHTLKGDRIKDEFLALLNQYIQDKYSPKVTQ